MVKQLRQWRGDDCCAPMIQCRSVFVSVSGSTGGETSRPQRRGRLMDLETWTSWCEFRVENGDGVTGTVGRLLEAERRMIGDGSVMAASPGQGLVHSPRAVGRASAGGDEGRSRRPAPSFRWPREQEQFCVPDKLTRPRDKRQGGGGGRLFS